LTSVRFPLATRPEVSVRHLGLECEPMLVLDGALIAPEAVVAEACRSEFSPARGPNGGYPGVRAPAPLDLVGTLSRALLPMIREVWNLPGARLLQAECNFSLVTVAPDLLIDSQREPHVDTDDPWQFAILLYLCSAQWGGTAFFRHAATGYETLRPERRPAYQGARDAEGPEGPGYFGGDSASFRQIGAVEAAFNRLVVYRSRLLHSGLVPRPEALSADPALGRLTLNIFLTLGS
jgi:hypothetical protein